MLVASRQCGKQQSQKKATGHIIYVPQTHLNGQAEQGFCGVINFDDRGLSGPRHQHELPGRASANRASYLQSIDNSRGAVKLSWRV
jgi:hypothetical protein